MCVIGPNCFSYIVLFGSLQRRRQLRGDASDEGHPDGVGKGGVEAAGDLPLVVRDGRRVLPVRRADLRHEVRKLDLRRVSGEEFM